MNNKAMGALASTCILIAFSMILGLIFMSWGKSYIEERAEFVVGVAEGQAGCVDVDIRFININNIPQVCHARGTLKALVENVGNTIITQVSTRVVDNSGVSSKEDALSQAVTIGQSSEVFAPTSPPAKQIKITPIIRTEGKKELCFDRSITADPSHYLQVVQRKEK